ncbi:hypothetical protein P7C70_g8415, partial [Phenoliferia sp. Uapishka_3]
NRPATPSPPPASTSRRPQPTARKGKKAAVTKRKPTKRPVIPSDEDEDLDADLLVSRPRKRRAQNKGAPLSLEASNRAQADIVESQYHARTTMKGYGGYIKRGCAFLANIVAGDRRMGIDKDHEDSLEDAFDVLSPRTVKWIIRYMVHQATVGGCQYGVIEGTRSAFKSYYKDKWNVDGLFTVDPVSGAYTGGNPCDDIGLKRVCKSYQNKQGRESGGMSRQSLPMRSLYLNWVKDYLDELPPTPENRLFSLYMMALLSLGFYLWTRIQEELLLRVEDFRFGLKTPDTLSDYFSVRITFRKCNQTDTKKGQTYDVHPEKEPEMYGMCAYTHVTNFFKEREKFTGCKPHPRHFFFAQIHGAIMKAGHATSQTEVSKKLDSIVYDIPALKAELTFLRGKLTMHCLRRGGVQHRYIYATVLWQLDACQWWGGWAINEGVGTLMRYLLEAQARINHSYGDMTSPDRDDRRHLLSRVGLILSAPTCDDLEKALAKQASQFRVESAAASEALEIRHSNSMRSFEKTMAEGFSKLCAFAAFQASSAGGGSSSAGSTTVPVRAVVAFAPPRVPSISAPLGGFSSAVRLPPPAIAISSSVLTPPSKRSVPTTSDTTPIAGVSSVPITFSLPLPAPLPLPCPSSSPTPTPVERTPLEIEDEELASRGFPTSSTSAPLWLPEVKSWESAVRSWTEADPEAGLDWPLERWRDSWHRNAAPALKSNLGVRKRFLAAWVDVGKDKGAFVAKFCGAGILVNEVLKEIRRVGQSEGKVKKRVGCKQAREIKAAALAAALLAGGGGT